VALKILVGDGEPNPLLLVLQVHELRGQDERIFLVEAISRLDVGSWNRISVHGALVTRHEHVVDFGSTAVAVNDFWSRVEENCMMEPSLQKIC
jgi:hypothetical protein